MDSEHSLEAFGWVESVDTPTLGEQEVHLWSVCLDALNELSQQCWGWLSDQEQQRAMCFQFAVDRQRFTNAHVAVRAILSQYARCHPAQLSFGQNAFT